MRLIHDYNVAVLILVGAVALLLLNSCCPKIISNTTAEVVKTRIDTVYVSDTITVEAIQTDAITIDIGSLCDSLLKARTETFTVTQKQTQKHRNIPTIEQVTFKKDSINPSLFNMRVNVSSYIRTIDSLRMQITVQDSVFREHTVVTNKCDKKFHHFTVYFFYMACALILIWLVLKWIKPV